MQRPDACSPSPVCLAVEAMRCRFELVLYGDDPSGLRAVGEEAIREIRHWDRHLNVFSSTSELSRINREAPSGPVTVSPRLFGLLTLARDLSVRTRGAFDPTLGPVVRLWREAVRTGRLPSSGELSEARALTGAHQIQLEPADRSVRFEHPGVELNLNALAKGHALDEAGLILKEAGVTSFLIQGGTSSVLASGTIPEGREWTIGLEHPARPGRTIERLALKDSGLGISSQHEQPQFIEGREVGHVISPLSGGPAARAHVAAVTAPSAVVADALSTALLVSDAASANWLLPDEQGLMLPCEREQARFVRIGIEQGAACGA